ncbi:MAG: hypothetical protein GWO20_08355 [Candidatus Korarchaeota archaeon]|nr:hypothetical protein [Candidatus Korarchaeota archaeon]
MAEIDFEENVTLVLASGDLVYNDTCSFTDGEHTIRIYANDTQGNCNTTQTVTFTVDTITPSVSIDSPQDNAIMNASSVTVTWSGSDPSPGSGIQTYAYQLDGGAWTNTTATSHTFTDLAEGEHTVRIKVYDWAGNEEVASVTFIVDTEDPTVSIISPEDDTTFEKDRVTVEWTGSDEGSGIDHYEVRIDNSGWETVDGTSYEFTDLNDGEHTVDVRVIDKSEKASMVSVSFTVNTSPIGGPGMMEEILIGAGVGVAIAAVAVALYFLKWKKT